MNQLILPGGGLPNPISPLSQAATGLLQRLPAHPATWVDLLQWRESSMSVLGRLVDDCEALSQVHGDETRWRVDEHAPPGDALAVEVAIEGIELPTATLYWGGLAGRIPVPQLRSLIVQADFDRAAAALYLLYSRDALPEEEAVIDLQLRAAHERGTIDWLLAALQQPASLLRKGTPEYN